MRTLLFSLLVCVWLLFPVAVHAVVNPLAVPNNKVGIHIISATPDESSPAASLVNSNGDWGYVTLVIKSQDRDKNKWQNFFNDLRRKHLIPIVRLATGVEGSYWKRPYEGEEAIWADFLNSLNWPTKNRYVIIYNEPNHGKEWGGFIDARSYARVLDKTIKALKEKNPDFFVLNAGLDASAPEQLPNYGDEITFLREMEAEVPGIFEKLDGWVSHSYPNPGFVGDPEDIGRGSIRGWFWELQQLRLLGLTDDLPVFITETGWKHSEGLSLDPSLPSAEIVASNYKKAFIEAWGSSRIVAVTPFLLTYLEPPFDHFSFKKLLSNDYYPQFQVIKDMPKVSGKPVQIHRAELIKGEVYKSVVAGENYDISLTFKNTGGSIWGDQDTIKLVAIEGGNELGINFIDLPKDVQVPPNQKFTFKSNIKAPAKGLFKTVLQLFSGDTQFESPALGFVTEVKSPVILQVKTALKWKKLVEGEYILLVEGAVGESSQKVYLNKSGQTEEIEARYLLPDYAFDFTLKRPYYQPKAIHQTLYSGVNVLNFGELEPDFASVLFNPKKLWELLPFSN